MQEIATTSTRRGTELAQDYLAFALLNVFDLFLTVFLLGVGHGEANPLGAMVLRRWGFVGLVVMKFALVIVVVAGLDALDRTRPVSARRVLRAGNTLYVALVVYESVLLARYRLF